MTSETNWSYWKFLTVWLKCIESKSHCELWLLLLHCCHKEGNWYFLLEIKIIFNAVIKIFLSAKIKSSKKVTSCYQYYILVQGFRVFCFFNWQFNTEDYSAYTYVLYLIEGSPCCSFHEIFIMVPKIFLCLHKGRFASLSCLRPFSFWRDKYFIGNYQK